MLRLLTDEQIFGMIATQVKARRPDIPCESILVWRDGFLCGEPGERVLTEAHGDGLTLVTYDTRTIPPLLADWGAQGRPHGGVIFVDNLSIRQSDVGGLSRALIALWDKAGTWEWNDRVAYLRPAFPQGPV